MFKFTTFSKKQRKALNWWTDKSPVKDSDGIIADGSIRSGKTVSMSLSYVMWSMSNFKNQNFGMAGKTIGTFRRNVLEPLKQMLPGRGYVLEEHRSDNYVLIRKGKVENVYYIFGGKDESSQDLIQGLTLAGMLFDEVALMPESFVNQAVGRCSVDGSKLFFNCNPSSPFHWFKVGWIDKHKEKNLLYIHFEMDDNLSLSERVKERLKTQFSGVFYKRFIMGLWVAAEGVIYDMFDSDRHIKARPKGEATEIFVSCDYGTQNATCFLLWEKIGKWHCTKEYYYSGRSEMKQKTDAEYADDLGRWLDGKEPERIIVDPSAASFIAELRKRGYKVRKAKNSVLDGIRFVASLLMSESFYIAPECVNLIKEMQSYVWDDKAADRGEDKPLKVNDHAVDALRYFCYTQMRIQREKISGGI